MMLVPPSDMFGR